MKWLDWCSLLADIVTFIGIPALLIQNRNLLQQYRESHRQKGVSEDCLEFLAPGRAVNLVPLSQLPTFPRVGESVYLPAEEGAEADRGFYRVDSLEYLFMRPTDDQTTVPVQAALGKVVAKVTKIH